MKKIFLINPRQTGKTDKAIYEYLKDPKNTLFISHSNDSSVHNLDKVNLPLKNKNFTSAGQFTNFIKGKRFKNIILDEYMFFKNKKEIYDLIRVINPKNLYIFSTSDKMYDDEIFEFVKEEKKKNYSLKTILNSYIKEKHMFYDNWEKAKEEIIDLYYNFITDSDTTLIDYYNFNNRPKFMENIRYGMSEKNFEVEIKNQYTTKGTDFKGDSKNKNTECFPYNI